MFFFIVFYGAGLVQGHSHAGTEIGLPQTVPTRLECTQNMLYAVEPTVLST